MGKKGKREGINISMLSNICLAGFSRNFEWRGLDLRNKGQQNRVLLHVYQEILKKEQAFPTNFYENENNLNLKHPSDITDVFTYCKEIN